MNNLQIFDYDGKLYADSREVAKMVGKRHADLMRDIGRYIDVMKKSNERKIASVDFFVESNYQDSKGESRPCYLITKKGCEFVANKLTGEKGILFTAEYITAFHDMEDKLLAPCKNVLYPPKASSAGEITHMAQFLDKIMIAQKASGHSRAIMTEWTFHTFGIDLPKEFVQPQPFEQTVLTCVSTIKIGNNIMH